MRQFTLTALVLAAAASLCSTASANGVTYTLADVLPQTTGYTENNVGQTYSGDGFVGVYDFNQFGHLMGLEGSFSKTNIQVGIGALAGANINAATLTFKVLEHFGNGTVSIDGYAGNGALGWGMSAPNAAYGSAGGALVAGDNQSYDLTAVVQAAANAGEDWLGLFMQNSDPSSWTYTYTGFGYSADRAEMRLTVDFNANRVPEPGSMALAGLALMGLALPALRRRQRV